MGKKKTLAIASIVLFIIAVSTIGPLIVKAESRIIIVPDDYPTLEAAVSNASSGDTIYLRTGVHEGPINKTITIDKPLTIIGQNAKQTIIKLYPAYNETFYLSTPLITYTDAIAITTDDCRILNLTLAIANLGGWISAIGDRTQIIGNDISVGYSTGLRVTGSNCFIADNSMNESFAGDTSGLIQVNGRLNEVARNTVSAVHLDGTMNVVKDNVFEYLNLGIYSNYTSDNLIVGNTVSGGQISIRRSNNNFFCKNSISGLSWAYGFEFWLSANNTIMANAIADAMHSMKIGGSSNNTVCLNNFFGDDPVRYPYIIDSYTDSAFRRFFPDIPLSTNLWDNGTHGNFWEGFSISDVNGDGIGDSPYPINEKNQDSYPLTTPVDINSVPVNLPDWALNFQFEPKLPQITVPPPKPSPTPTLLPTPSSMQSPSLPPTTEPTPNTISTPEPSTTIEKTMTPFPMFTKQPGFLDTSLPVEYAYAIVAVLVIIVVAGLSLVYFMKHRK
jgi:parallel beta-helix repeat protein